MSNRAKDITAMLFAAIMLIAVAGIVYARAADMDLTEAWILCQPDSYVNIRARASSKSQIDGYLLSGDRIWLDGETCDGFAHIDRASTERGEGWVHAGYIVFDKPQDINRQCVIRTNGRVACRRTIDGHRRCWVVNGSTVYVYKIAGEWAVTDKGFIKSEYISGAEEQ